MKRPRRDSPQTAGVLLALADRGGEWSHGYELCTNLGLKAGTVYPILMRLADRGHVETAWEQDAPRGRPPRHLYRLTEAGAERALEARNDLAVQRASGMRSRPGLGPAPQSARA